MKKFYDDVKSIIDARTDINQAVADFPSNINTYVKVYPTLLFMPNKFDYNVNHVGDVIRKNFVDVPFYLFTTLNQKDAIARLTAWDNLLTTYNAFWEAFNVANCDKYKIIERSTITNSYGGFSADVNLYLSQTVSITRNA